MDENNTQTQNPSSHKKFLGVALVAALLVAVGGFAYFKKVDAPEVTPTATSEKNTPALPVASSTTTITPATKEEIEKTPAPTGMFKDGVYTTQGAYTSPAGKESVSITLTIKDDVIVAATGSVLATNAASQKFQTQFVGGFAVQVIGKKISEVSLSKVSGSSLTPKGFNDAVLKIQAEAKA